MTEDNVIELSGTRPPAIPEFITMSDIDSMNDEQLDAMVAAIRVRRMRSAEIYERTVAEKDRIAEEKARVKVTKKCEQIFKTLDTMNKQFEKLEHQIAELRGLRLQAGMELV